MEITKCMVYRLKCLFNEVIHKIIKTLNLLSNDEDESWRESQSSLSPDRYLISSTLNWFKLWWKSLTALAHFEIYIFIIGWQENDNIMATNNFITYILTNKDIFQVRKDEIRAANVCDVLPICSQRPMRDVTTSSTGHFFKTQRVNSLVINVWRLDNLFGCITVWI